MQKRKKIMCFVLSNSPLLYHKMENILFNSFLFKTLSNLEKKKYHLLVRVLKFLYFKGPNPVADICSHLKISSPNGNAILAMLMEYDLIEKKGYGLSKGGRKPELYGLKADAFYVVSVDMNVHKTSLAIFDSENKQVTNSQSFSLEMNNELSTLEKLTDHIQQFINDSKTAPDKIIGVGVSMPGLVDSKNGFNFF